MRPAQKEKENALQLELYLDQYQYLGNYPSPNSTTVNW